MIMMILLLQFSGEGNGTPLQFSCLENPMGGGAWWAAVHGVSKSWTRLSDFTFTFHFHALEKEMADHSSVLAWRIPGTVEPDGMLSIGSHRVGHNWSDLAATAVRFSRDLSNLLPGGCNSGCQSFRSYMEGGKLSVSTVLKILISIPPFPYSTHLSIVSPKPETLYFNFFGEISL